MDARAEWVRLEPAELDLGEGECVAWVHADPFAALGVGSDATDDELRRAYRGVARRHHPDLNPGDPDALDRFHDVQRALDAATGEAELAVEPAEGVWWRFAGFVTPPRVGPGSPVAGIRLELRAPHRVPFRGAEDMLRVTYAGRSLPLGVGYARSAVALPLWSARFAVFAEHAFLFAVCLVLVPVLALLAAVDFYVLSNANAAVAWACVLAIVGLGYGALAAILASAGREVPTPRRIVQRTRAYVVQRRALPARR